MNIFTQKQIHSVDIHIQSLAHTYGIKKELYPLCPYEKKEEKKNITNLHWCAFRQSPAEIKSKIDEVPSRYVLPVCYIYFGTITY